jgi:hypothetical protein
MVIVPVVYLPGITLIEILKATPYRTQQNGHVHVRIRFQILDLYGDTLRIDGSLLLIALLARLYSGEVQPPVRDATRLHQQPSDRHCHNVAGAGKAQPLHALPGFFVFWGIYQPVNQMLIQLVTDGRLKEHLLGKLQVRLQAKENNPAAIDKTDVIDIRGTADNGRFTVLTG